MARFNNDREATKGDTAMWSLTLYDEQGDAYVPSVGEVLTFYLLKKECDDLSEALLTKNIPIPGMQLELTPQETGALAVGSYAYKVRITDLGGHEWTVIKAKLKVIC